MSRSNNSIHKYSNNIHATKADIPKPYLKLEVHHPCKDHVATYRHLAYACKTYIAYGIK